MGEYDRQIETALRLIAKKGQTVVWRRLTLNITDTDQPWKPGNDTAVEENVSIVFLPTKNKTIYKGDDGEVSASSVQGLMGAQSFEPSDKDVVIRNGETLHIKSIDKLAPNGQTILFTIEFEQ